MKEVVDFLKENIKPNKTLITGISGGADSMCLIHLLVELKKERPLTIVVAHINHGIREESEEESEFVKKYCEKTGCIFEYKKLTFEEKTNFEAQARVKRYNFFEELIKKYQAEYLLTAHHGDDLVETILMHLTRGSTLHGYSGFQSIEKRKNYDLLRPLIFITKHEIEEYNKENNIEYRIDKTNKDLKYTRNRYREKILPFLKEENQSVHKKFLKFSEELNLIDKYLEKQTNTCLTRVIDFDKVNLREFNKLDLLMQNRVIEYFLKEEYKSEIHNLNHKHIKLIKEMCKNKNSNITMNLPLKRILRKEYETLYFMHNCEEKMREYILNDCVEWNSRETIFKIEDTPIEKSNYILRLNSKEVAMPLKVRTRKQADKMEVKNLNGSQKIKDIFINEKISKEKRDSWPIVVDSNENILWLPGLKKSKFDKNKTEFCDIIYKYVMSEEKQNEEK